jgi:putative tricarboxylic transport membrane protein
MKGLNFLRLSKFYLLIFSFALLAYLLLGNIEANDYPGHLGPAFWPKTVLSLLMIICGFKLVKIFFSHKEQIHLTDNDHSDLNYFTLFAMIVTLFGGIVAMNVLGFLLANFIFLILFMRIAGLKKKLQLFMTSTIGTIFLLYLFIKVVYLPLPKGQGMFYDLTLYLYKVLHLI